MDCAPAILPMSPPNGVTCGIDWSTEDHAVSVVDADGRQCQRWTAEHTESGLTGLVSRISQLGVTEVAIGRPGRIAG
jgi:transposase